MAQARQETTIDLDEPDPNEDPYAMAPPITAPYHQALSGYLHKRFYNGDIEVPKNEERLEQDRAQDARIAAAVKPAYDLWWPGAIANHFQGKRVEAAKQAEQMAQLTEKEKLLLKAKENAQKIAAYKAQQEKVEQDRDQSAAEGRGGYRIERALYPSDFLRK